ncbi:phosphatidate cytidylyltransferase [Bacillaceae bacterium SIJ1]|uniref:phosphatidate cytidylyltransferase n=1 Tax=Litoribacterium kuwaitense TaxID=1398745 RepID=UPI0013EA2259|nr:phosphatidate cytidylyltransferase [Litoribacterium kuwaitense]NGP44096.1 phosphatidate cytidylyltransferase [Litoribacterium kuwaitense]
MKTRIWTAVGLLLLFVPLLVIGGWPFTTLVYIIATICLYEFFMMKNLNFFSFYGIVSTVVLWFILLPGKESVTLFTETSITKLELLSLAILFLLSLTVMTKNKLSIEDMSFVLFGTLYVGIGCYFLIELRELDLTYILYALIVIWATDTGAYFIGKTFGRHKLWPDISPNKTTEGFLGGIACALVASFFLFQGHDLFQSHWIGLLLTALLSVSGQMGDLAESAFKRHFGVKDSGKILPGHGGVLDRIDSLLFVLPLLYILQVF